MLYVRTISDTRERDAKEWLARVTIAVASVWDLAKDWDSWRTGAFYIFIHNILFSPPPRRQSGLLAGLGGGGSGLETREAQSTKHHKMKCEAQRRMPVCMESITKI